MKKIIFILLLAFLGASLGYCQGQDIPLRLTIKADKEIYFLDDEIKIVFEWENIGDKEIRFIPLPTGYIYTDSWINVYNKNDKLMNELFLIELSIKPVAKESIVTLKPQEKYSNDLTGTIKKGLSYYNYKISASDFYDDLYIDFQDSAILLDSGYGEYKLRAELELPFDSYYNGDKEVFNKELWTGELTSNEVIIEIFANSSDVARDDEISISKEKALQVAKGVCEKEGWQWLDIGITEEKINGLLLRTQNAWEAMQL